MSAWLALHIPIEILVRPQGFQIDQPHGVLAGVAQQIQLAVAAEFMHPQLGQIAFFALAQPPGFCATVATAASVSAISVALVSFL